MLDLRSGAANVAADALGTVSSFCRGFGHDCGHSHLEALISLPFLMSDGPAEGHPCLAKPRQFGLAHAKGEGAQILAIERQDVEGIQLDFVIVLARVQGIEIGNAVDAEDDRFAIDDELLHPVLERGFHDPGVSPGPVVTIAGDQSHTIAIALHAQPVCTENPIRVYRMIESAKLER